MEAAVVIVSKSASTMLSKSGNVKTIYSRALNLLHKTKTFGIKNSQPLLKVFKTHPITRGMFSYLVIWPTGNIIQQTMCEKEYDWLKVLRFGLYGSLVTAPSLFAWMKLASFMYPKTNLRYAITKAIIEQFSYTPLAMSVFFYSMTWLETFSAAEAWQEVKYKLPPTYLAAISVWPIIGTINFAFIPERNRVFFISCFSLMWTIYLGAIKSAKLSSLTDNDHSTESDDITNSEQEIIFMKSPCINYRANLDCYYN